MQQDPNNMDKALTKRLIEDCLARKGWTRERFAAAVGMQFPKIGHDPKPLAVQTLYNAFTPSGRPLKAERVAKWCSILGYPIDDLLNGRPYADPQSIEHLAREHERALKRISDLEEEVQKLKEVAGQVTT